MNIPPPPSDGAAVVVVVVVVVAVLRSAPWCVRDGEADRGVGKQTETYTTVSSQQPQSLVPTTGSSCWSQPLVGPSHRCQSPVTVTGASHWSQPLVLAAGPNHWLVPTTGASHQSQSLVPAIGPSHRNRFQPPVTATGRITVHCYRSTHNTPARVPIH